MMRSRCSGERKMRERVPVAAASCGEVAQSTLKLKLACLAMC